MVAARARWPARRVAVTRARAQASELAGRLRALGAEVLETPSIRIVPTGAELPAAARASTSSA